MNTKDKVQLDIRKATAAAEVISFDIFDTLFVRPLCDPEDLFDIVGDRIGMRDFRERRRAAQSKAFQVMHANGLKEITLDGIYAVFDGLPVARDEVRKIELDLELELTRPNPELIDLFLELANARRVVITSDMYLQLDFFEALFHKYGLPRVPLFISSHRNATKRDFGELFDIVAAECGVAPERVLHIGDNELSDVRRAREKRLAAFHYVDARRSSLPAVSTPAASLAAGMFRAYPGKLNPDSFGALGFAVGGPAALAFLHWINRKAVQDDIELILFTARDGYVLDRMEKRGHGGQFGRCEYFKSSRTALTLAAIDETNFEQHIPLLLSGAEELSPFELLERIGVVAPADNVMRDLGLGPEILLDPTTIELFKSFLWAIRWEILKTCRETRAALFNYLIELGVKPGMRIAMVDVGWNGTTQEAFHCALQGMFDIELYGYYLCLTEHPECVRRRKKLRMDALLTARSIGHRLLERVYANRVAVELFFSAPHHAVIGYKFDAEGRVLAVEDQGRGATHELSDISDAISRGVEEYGAYASELFRRVRVDPAPEEVVKPLLAFVENMPAQAMRLLQSVSNFDAWASSRNRDVSLTEYLG
ncbi:HAD-IA family hydrolase [Caballeronia sp. GACF4]|uniref:HAD-IA family hydrolase n=1 Tax=Caballeronia sp. GACF4 TaxID=2921763 RepID=UPI002028236F|nr:HAD-IA family hydrolase [Caballeronia sp. GACF4]